MPNEQLERMRFLSAELEWGGSGIGTACGVFMCRRRGTVLRIIASDGGDWAEEGLPGTPWEHVSVSIENRCPRWDEMCFVKDLFWLPEESVLQLHPPKSAYINNHPYCLHLWRPVGIEIPLPPGSTVGVQGVGRIRNADDAARLLGQPTGETP